jgi:hypothetical protein
MRVLFRKALPLLCFLLLLGALVASASKAIDGWMAIVVWRGLLIGSVLLIIKNVRQPPENRGFQFGQLAVLPRSWQRWILGEDGPSKTQDRQRQ